MKNFVLSLSFEQIKALNLWIYYIGLSFFIFSFLTLFWFPAVFDINSEKKEFFLFTPFLAFKRNIVFIFKNFLGSFGIMLFLLFLNTILSLFSVIFNLNIILAIIGLLVSFYFMTYVVVLIFLYYETRKN